MPYIATINVPGCLPDDTEPHVFDTTREAWEYLADERKRDEDDVPSDGGYSETANTLELLSGDLNGLTAIGADDGCGTVTGSTPGYEGNHDLGLAYSVSEAS